ncbi:hypothetical protein HW555_003766 [Spodoptera exigua]|uniref:Uncharacterized protein n=1 Tax=Spodoptera exigua TaxID=7107 RepID=A0A835L851_SPOEX|nr:hypothetical protein HW555_003766 [Spodoptera exigua]
MIKRCAVHELEESCVRQGGLCVMKSDCPPENIVFLSGTLCPKQQHLGVTCELNMTAADSIRKQITVHEPQPDDRKTNNSSWVGCNRVVIFYVRFFYNRPYLPQNMSASSKIARGIKSRATNRCALISSAPNAAGERAAPRRPRAHPLRPTTRSTLCPAYNII